MYARKILHQQLALDWPSMGSIKEPKTLILGSFNPYKPSAPLDYYYGRSSNYLWKVVAELSGFDHEYFQDPQVDSDDRLKRKLQTMQGHFAFADFIDHIEISSASEEALNKFVEEEVFKNFSDQNIWLSDSGKHDVFVYRSYNTAIYDFIEYNDSLTTVIHTLGKSNLDLDVTSPVERYNYVGFRQYVDDIKDLCQSKNIQFIEESHSPSGRVISYPGESYNQLLEFYKKHLNL